MENIIIFIIIIIISSVISKNKKKQQEASGNQREIPKNVFNEIPKKKQYNEPSPQLGELLKRLKEIKQETEGSRTFSDKKNRAEQVKPAGDKEYSSKENYEETFSYDEPAKETYSYETAEKTYDTETKSYDEIAAYEERNVNYDDNKSNYMTSERRQPADEAGSAGHKVYIKANIFDTRSKLKNAIIASEILQRKYT